MVSRRRVVRGISSGFALAGGISMSGVRRRQGMADIDTALEMHRLRAEDLGDRRDDLSPDSHAIEHVVRCDLAGDVAEAWSLRSELARHARSGLVRDRVGVAAQVAASDGASRPRPSVRCRRGRRVLRRRQSHRQTGGVNGQSSRHDCRGKTWNTSE
jgi:hypothetical protein